MDKTIHHIAFQTVPDVFYLRKINEVIICQLVFQLLAEATSMLWNYFKCLPQSERVLFYYHGEIQAYDHIILRIIRESL